MSRSQVVQAKTPAGSPVDFRVTPVPSSGEVIMDQVVAGQIEGYRGRLTAQEAADLGAALLMASGALHYSSS